MAVFFIELGFVMILVLGISILMHFLKQPLLIGYILAGVLAGPLFLNVLGSVEGYESFARIGVALLLFIVGLHLNVKLIKEVGFYAVITGILQVFFTTVFGFMIGLFFGLGFLVSLFLGIALSFSSTVIIVKILSDTGQIGSLSGKLTLGVLLLQDLIAILVMVILNLFANSSGDIFATLSKTFVAGAFFILFIMFFSYYVLEKFLYTIAKSKDLMFIFVISWCLAISVLFYSLGFSIEIGALIAGISLAASKYQHEFSSKLKPLRDFFIVMFFILLGSQMVPVSGSDVGGGFMYLFSNFRQIFWLTILFSFFVIVLKPFIVFLILSVLKFHTKVSFSSGVYLGQVSEFSLILVLLAKGYGFVNSQVVSVVTFSAIITIFASTFFIVKSEALFARLNGVFKFFKLRSEVSGIECLPTFFDVVIFGLNRTGSSLVKTLQKKNKSFLVVDFDPKVIARLERKGIACVYADAGDVDFLGDFDFKNVRYVVSTVSNFDTNLFILKSVKSQNKYAKVFLTGMFSDDCLELYSVGADYVISPHFIGGRFLSELVDMCDLKNEKEFLNEKIMHMNELHERKK